MQSSRDSSVWRSLAVAFGDGVAFGVGMKLTQSAARQAASAEALPGGDRLEELEQRLTRLEQAPAALPPGPSGSFDRKVMEAVVNALDARLHELSGQVERRLTEAQAKIALELEALDQQDHVVASEAGSRVEEVRAKCEEQLAAFRQSVDAEFAAFRGARPDLEAAATRIAREQAAAELDAYAASLEPALGEQIAATVQAAVAAQLSPIEDQLREDIRQEAGRFSSLAASAAEAVLEERMGPLRSELAARNAEIAELRQRVAQADRNTLDVLLAIGGICREASGRMSPPAAPPPVETAPVQPGEFESPSVAMPEPPEPEETPAPAEKAETPPALLPIGPQSERNGHAGSQPQGLEALPLPTPTFGEIKRSGRPWRIPLVSSFLLTTAGLALMRLL
jgi:hypothetical protein